MLLLHNMQKERSFFTGNDELITYWCGLLCRILRLHAAEAPEKRVALLNMCITAVSEISGA